MLTRAGGGDDGDGLSGARDHRSVRGLGVVGRDRGRGGGGSGARGRAGLRGRARSGGGSGARGRARLRGGSSRVGARSGGACRGGGGARRGGSSAGGAGSGPRLVLVGRTAPAVTPRLNVTSRALGSSGVSLTTDLHDTSKGRGGNEAKKSNGLDHFEKLKSLSLER